MKENSTFRAKALRRELVNVFFPTKKGPSSRISKCFFFQQKKALRRELVNVFFSTKKDPLSRIRKCIFQRKKLDQSSTEKNFLVCLLRSTDKISKMLELLLKYVDDVLVSYSICTCHTINRFASQQIYEYSSFTHDVISSHWMPSWLILQITLLENTMHCKSPSPLFIG